MVGYFWRGVENRLLYRIRCMFAGFGTGCSVDLNSCLGLNWIIFAFQLVHGGWHLNGLGCLIGRDVDVSQESSS